MNVNISSCSYWGTLENIVTVPDAHFTALIIIGSAIYGLILTEIGIASTDPSECRMTTVQKGILKRSLLVTLALFFYGITTTGYVQDNSGDLQGVTSVLMVRNRLFYYLARRTCRMFRGGLLIPQKSVHFDELCGTSMYMVPLQALIVFLVYTAYCETDVFYRVVWAHHKKKKEAKSLSLSRS